MSHCGPTISGYVMFVNVVQFPPVTQFVNVVRLPPVTHSGPKISRFAMLQPGEAMVRFMVV